MTTAVVPYEQIKTMAKSDVIQDQFLQLLGEEDAKPYIASVLTIVATDDRLKQCTPASIWSAASRAAGLRLSVDKNLGWAYLIAYKNNKTGKLEANFQFGYKGYIQLALRTQKFKTINVAPVYEGQVVIIDQLTGEIRLNGSKKSEVVEGYCAYFRLHSGYEKFCYMTIKEIHDHAKKYNPNGYKQAAGPWKRSTKAMEMKTPLRSLLKTWAPLEIRDVLPDETEDQEEYIDAQFADADETPEADPNTSGKRVWHPEIIELFKKELGVEDGFKPIGRLNLSNLNNLTVTFEQVLTWHDLYKSWRDGAGLEADEAAANANAGKKYQPEAEEGE